MFDVLALACCALFLFGEESLRERGSTCYCNYINGLSLVHSIVSEIFTVFAVFTFALKFNI